MSNPHLVPTWPVLGGGGGGGGGEGPNIDRCIINLPSVTIKKIIASAILLFRNATTENRSVNWTTVNCPRGGDNEGDKKQCQIPTWSVGTPGGGAA